MNVNKKKMKMEDFVKQHSYVDKSQAKKKSLKKDQKNSLLNSVLFSI